MSRTARGEAGAREGAVGGSSMTRGELYELAGRESAVVVITTGAPHFGVTLEDGDYYDGQVVRVTGETAALLVVGGRARLAPADAEPCNGGEGEPGRRGSFPEVTK